MSLQTPLHRVEGLGSAKAGTAEFWRQRVTAIALVPLSLWFVWAALALVGADHAAVTAFLADPVNAVLMLLFLIAALYHMSIGIQIIIEDYVQQPFLKVSCIILNRFFALALGAATAFALLKIAFGQT
ncbi:MAG: succinate dehydrogenase, hydrophobic membrane anchor protein [Alphaproteobacteria bacterium]